MPKTIKIVLIQITLIGAINAGGFALSGVGSRALSLGGAFRAIANDWSAIFWNPAGVYGQQQFIAINGMLVSPSASYEPNTGILGYDGPYSLREKVNAASQNFLIPSFSYLTPMEIAGGNIAFSFTVPFGLGSKWDLYDFPIGYYNTTDTSFKIPEIEKYDWQSNLSVYNIHFTYSNKITEKIYAGFSFGVSRTSIMLRKIKFFDPAEMDTTAYSLPLQYRLFPVATEVEGSGWGVSGILGVIFTINDNLKLGASVRAYSKVNIDGTTNLTLYFPKNDYLASQMPPEKEFMFSGTTASGSGTFKTSLNLPVNIGAGVAYSPSEKINLALDVDWTRWFTLDRIKVEFENTILKIGGTIPLDTIKEETLELLWKNTYRVSTGIEYKLNNSLTLRTGLYWDQSPVPDNTITVLIPDPGDKYSLNLGIGYTFGNIEINGNYEYLLPSSRDVNRSSDYSYKSNYLAGKYSMFVQGVGVNIVYKF
ncbi:MAG: outer membrane protein transport protein [candidate division WOR-3 bacterium]